MADKWTNHTGTRSTQFKIRRATVSASGLTADRTQSLPDLAGTVIVTSDPHATGYVFQGIPGVELYRPTSPNSTLTAVQILPKHGGIVPIYNSGGFMEFRHINQNKDYTIGGRTAGQIHDVFAVAAGTNGVNIAIGPAWTNNTTRSVALADKYGYAVNNASFTDIVNGGTIAQWAGLHVGTVRFTAATTTAHDATRAFLWSRYHQRPWNMLDYDGTSHSQSGAAMGTPRPWNNATGTIRLEIVSGETFDVPVRLSYRGAYTQQYIGVGKNATNSFTEGNMLNGTGSTMDMSDAPFAIANPGYQYFELLEQNTTTASVSWWNASLRAQHMC